MAGASKRGYSTWHVAAVDPRVIAIVPIVMDELNFADNVQHHYRSLGGACLVLISLSLSKGWSFVLEDFWHMNLTMLFNEPEMQVKWEDFKKEKFQRNGKPLPDQIWFMIKSYNCALS